MKDKNEIVFSGALKKEFDAVEAMIKIYCNGNHGTKRELCRECNELTKYAMKRLDLCPYGEKKPTCSKCPIHCYKPNEKEKIKAVMRYSGMRMMFRHPVIAINHLLREKDEPVGKPPRGASNRHKRKQENKNSQ